MRREERLGMPGGFVEGTTRRVVVIVQTLRGTSRVLRVVVVDRRRPAAPRRPGRGPRRMTPAATPTYGAPSGPNYLLFVDADRLPDALWDRSGVGWSLRPHAAALGALQRALDPKLWGIMVVVRALLGTCTDMYLLIEAPAPAASAFAHV